MLLIVVNVAQINCHALMGNMKIVSREFLELMICVRTIHVLNEQGYMQHNTLSLVLYD